MASVKLFTQSLSCICAEKFGINHAYFDSIRRLLVFYGLRAHPLGEYPAAQGGAWGLSGQAQAERVRSARRDLIQDEVVDLLRGVNMSNTNHRRRFSCSNVVATLVVSTGAIQG